MQERVSVRVWPSAVIRSPLSHSNPFLGPESLHLGNLLGIIALSWFQRCGHTPVALLGGATGRVGDPSGKSAERPMMDEETIERHVAGIQTILVNILRVEEEPTAGGGAQGGQGQGQKPIFVNNYDWWKEVSLLGFLRDVGKYARVGTMMAKESVKKRLKSEEGMSYTEFTYQLLQVTSNLTLVTEVTEETEETEPVKSATQCGRR